MRFLVNWFMGQSRLVVVFWKRLLLFAFVTSHVRQNLVLVSLRKSAGKKQPRRNFWKCLLLPLLHKNHRFLLNRISIFVDFVGFIYFFRHQLTMSDNFKLDEPDPWQFAGERESASLGRVHLPSK